MSDVDPSTSTHPSTTAPVTTPGRRRGALIGGATALALVIAGGGIAVGASVGSPQATTATTQFEPSVLEPQSPLDTTAATDPQKVGVVTILTTLYYQDDAQAAGTGIILTSSGEILTNNHVIQGATSIEVTVESTGKTYTADVVGSDTVDDIAVLQLEGASGLDAATLDSTTTVATGDAVTDVGNAEGTGDLVAAAGTVSAIDQSITVNSDLTGNPETLYGLIEVSADVVSGDSGGPLLDADGEVVGIVTAAFTGSREIAGFAIPIESALGIVDQIEAGSQAGNVTIGLPAFLGVTLDSPATGQAAIGSPTDRTTIAGTVAGTAAASAGLVAGDTITAVDGTAVTTADELSRLIASHHPGDRVTVSYTDSTGAAQQVVVTLGEGPAA